MLLPYLTFHFDIENMSPIIMLLAVLQEITILNNIDLLLKLPVIVALVDLFNKADVTKTGCITLKDYINICEDHGMVLDEEDLETINALVNDYGKVGGIIVNTFFLLKCHIFLDIQKRLFLSC